MSVHLLYFVNFCSPVVFCRCQFTCCILLFYCQRTIHCSGHFGISKHTVAEAAFNALRRFNDNVKHTRYITEIHFVNIDKEANQCFLDVFSNNQLPSTPQPIQLAFHRPYCPSNTATGSPRRERRLKKSTRVNESGDQQDLPGVRDVDQVHVAILIDIDDNTTVDPKNHLSTPVTAVTPVTPVTAAITSSLDTLVEDCVICMCPMTYPHRLPCGHSFCEDCIRQSFDKCGEKCPSCGRLYGVQRGNQPHGTMQHYTDVGQQLAGYHGYGTIVITYNIPDGVQSVRCAYNIILER